MTLPTAAGPHDQGRTKTEGPGEDQRKGHQQMSYAPYRKVIEKEPNKGADLSRPLGNKLKEGVHAVGVCHAVAALRGTERDWVELRLANSYGDELSARLWPWKLAGDDVNFSENFTEVVAALLPTGWMQLFESLSLHSVGDCGPLIVRALTGTRCSVTIGRSDGYRITTARDGGYLAVDSYHGNKLCAPLATYNEVKAKMGDRPMSYLRVTDWRPL